LNEVPTHSRIRQASIDHDSLEYSYEFSLTPHTSMFSASGSPFSTEVNGQVGRSLRF